MSVSFLKIFFKKPSAQASKWNAKRDNKLKNKTVRDLREVLVLDKPKVLVCVRWCVATLCSSDTHTHGEGEAG